MYNFLYLMLVCVYILHDERLKACQKALPFAQNAKHSAQLSNTLFFVRSFGVHEADVALITFVLSQTE